MRPFNIANDDIGAYARQMLARRGINPDTVDTTDNSIADGLTDAYRTKLETLTRAKFRDLQPTDDRITAWIRSYLDNPAGTPNLFLRGPTGTGKSHNAYAALWNIVLTTARRGQRITFTKTSQADFNQAMRPNADGSHLDALTEFQTVDLLMFDDFGAGQLTEWAEDTLLRLVDARWGDNLPTIITSNLTAQEMRAIDERIVSRLATPAQYTLGGGDHRRMQP